MASDTQERKKAHSGGAGGGGIRAGGKKEALVNAGKQLQAALATQAAHSPVAQAEQRSPTSAFGTVMAQSQANSQATHAAQQQVAAATAALHASHFADAPPPAPTTLAQAQARLIPAQQAHFMAGDAYDAALTQAAATGNTSNLGPLMDAANYARMNYVVAKANLENHPDSSAYQNRSAAERHQALEDQHARLRSIRNNIPPSSPIVPTLDMHIEQAWKRLNAPSAAKAPQGDGTFGPIAPHHLDAEGLMKGTTAPHPGLGKFEQTYKASSNATPDARAAFQSLFGKSLSEDALVGAMGKLIGAPDGSHVEVSGHGDQLTIRAHHDGLSATQTRRIKRDGNQIVMKNDLFQLKNGPKDASGGLHVFGRQVAEARKLGINRIDVHGVGNWADHDHWNGYYTWPRFGYDGPIPAHDRNALPSAFRQATTYQKLFAMPGGAAAWQKHGTDVTISFDLKKNSVSSKALRNYAASKGVHIKGL